jgi:PAS domain S-box-containing protein
MWQSACAASSAVNSLQAMSELPQIYNSRILKFYGGYLRERYPAVDIEQILTYAGVSKFELDDPGHWFNQEQMDRFQEKIVELTRNESISREVGRYAVISDTSGPIKHHALGLLKISTSYLLLTKLYPMLSRGAKVTSRKIASNKVEIDVVPGPDVVEKPYQCENRIGMFESLATLYTSGSAKIDHSECVHKGDDRCRYTATWQEPEYPKLWRILPMAVGAALLLFTISIIFWPAYISFLICFIGGAGISAAVIRSLVLEKRELIRVIQNQGNTAEQHIQEIDYRYRGARLIQKIGRATSAVLDTDALARIVVQNIRDYLDFDRGMIMLADKDRKRLLYAAGFGFDGASADLLNKTQFRLDNPASTGIFVKIFHERQPVLIDDIGKLRGSLSSKSQQLIDRIGSKSMICLPIVYEDVSLGILAVDNIVTKRPLTKSDMNLLMGVAYQTAVSLFSANAFEELQSSEERYRSLYENAPTAYISLRIENAVIVHCNAAAVRLFGYERNQLIGSSLMRYVAPGNESRDKSQWILKLLQAGQSFYNEPIELIDHDGRSIWAHASLEPFKGASSDVVEGRCILVDITQQKYLEEKLQHAQKMETIGTLAGGVAHDLNNILAAIVSYPDLLLMDIPPESPLHDPLLKIKEAGYRAAAIVNDLLTLSRRGVPISDVVDINDTIRLFLASPEYEDLMERHPGIDVVTHLDGDGVAIKGSPVQLGKTLMNIVFNAVEAIVDDGKIHIATHKEDIRLGDPRLKGDPGNYAVLTVKDNGSGIAPMDLKRVFEPFFTRKVMGRSGTGLGMAIVWAAVEDHMGFIDIDSQVGLGTTVRLYFPATLEKQTFPRPSGSNGLASGKGEKILIVDDNLEHRDIASRMLTRLGYEVAGVENGEAAIAKFKEKYRPALVLLDMQLGQGIDGYETYRQILSIYPEQKAIFVSGYSESDRVKQARRLGGGGFLKKPFSLKDLGAAILHEIDS